MMSTPCWRASARTASHELRQRGPRHVELGDHLAALDRRAELAIEIGVIRLRIVARAGGCRSSTAGRRSPCSSARTRRRPATCTVCASRSSRRHSCGASERCSSGIGTSMRHRPVAGEHAGLQELARRGIGGELAVAELVAFAHPQVEERRQVVDVRRSTTRRSTFCRRASRSVTRRDRPEQAVAADRQREQPRIDGPAAALRARRARRRS